MKGCLTYSSPVTSHCLYKQARNNTHREKLVTGPVLRKKQMEGVMKISGEPAEKLREFCQVGKENENLLQTNLIHTQNSLTVYLLCVITHMFYKPTPIGVVFSV